MIKIDWKPPNKTLRIFSVVTCVFCGLIGLWLRGGGATSQTIGLVLWALGAAVLLVGLAWPRGVIGVYVVLNAIALPIGLVVSTVILAVIYYLVLTPMGLVLRLFGHDPMKKRLEPDQESYWTERQRPDSVKRYFRQY